jgi:hypothetical protein
MLSNLLVVLGGLLAALYRADALRGFGRPLGGHMALARPLLATTAAMGEWLEDAIYSGDVPGFLRRRAKDLLKDEFLSFVEDKIEVSQECHIHHTVPALVQYPSIHHIYSTPPCLICTPYTQQFPVFSSGREHQGGT